MDVPIQRLAEAGLVDANSLNQNDIEVLSQLTEQEVTVLIQVAMKFYPEGRAIIRLGDLRAGAIRLFVPL